MTQITSAAFLAALKATPLGEPFVAVGEIAPVTLKGLQFAPALVVDLRGATFERIVVDHCIGLQFLGGTAAPPAPPALMPKNQVYVTWSQDIEFLGTSTLGNGSATAFTLADNDGIRILNCRIDRAFQGINSGRNKNVRIAGNSIVGQNNDGIVIAQNDNVVIEDNDISATQRQDLRHPDGIQFIYRGDGLYSTNVTVRNNVIVIKAQGIFGGGIKGGVIRGNHVKVDHSGGIYFMDVIDVDVLDNVVETLGDGKDWAQILYKKTPYRTRKGNVVKAHGRFAEVRD